MMLSRLRQRSITHKLTQSLSLPFLTIPISHTTSSTSTDISSENDIPQYDKPMKKPIITGRNSSEAHGELHDEFPNPFIDKELPFGRKVIFDTDVEENLAEGHHWHAFKDRFMQELDIDMIERAYGQQDLYRSPYAKRSTDDITMSHDMDYHYYLHNAGMHVEMMRYVPHLKPLWREISQDFENVTCKWQDILEEILGERENETEYEHSESISINEKTDENFSDNLYEKISTKIETKKTKLKMKQKPKNGQNYFGPNSGYKFKNFMIEKRPLVGEELISERKKKIKNEMNINEEKERKKYVKRQIELETIKQFVDDKVEEKDFVRLVFIDAMGTKYYVYGMIGETLLQCCRRYLIPIDGYCEGYDRGIVRVYGAGPQCYTCQMDISPKYFHLIPAFDWRERAAITRFRHITPTSRLGCCICI